MEGVYHGLVDLLAHFHAVLDYPDEDIGPLEAEQIGGVLSAAAGELRRLLETYQRGRFLVRGVPCAIVGLPNAGKSSLLNALVGYQRAIVTDIPGTTRDTVEERCMLGGVLLRLIDTAGLRETDDPVERLGVARSRAALEGAELALVLMDGSAPAEDLDRLTAELQLWEEAARTCPRTILVLTKADLPRGADRGFSVLGGEKAPPVVRLSARTGEGLAELSDAVQALFPQGTPGEEGAVLTNARQAEAAERALRGLERAGEGLDAGVTPDAVLTDVEGAVEALGELSGRNIREDVVARIFARFCVGK